MNPRVEQGKPTAERMVPLLLLVSILVFGDESASAQQCPPQGWKHGRIVTIKNDGPPLGKPLEKFQVRIDLDASSINFSEASTDGSDVRLAMLDGGAAAPFWIERWDPIARRARIWVRVASLLDETRLCLSYGNPAAPSASNGSETFLFFDDFAVRGYFKLSGPQTVLWRQRHTFETTAPHTLSVVQVPDDLAEGFPYWGYYGPSYWATETYSCPPESTCPGCRDCRDCPRCAACTSRIDAEKGWVARVRSQDLVHWERVGDKLFGGNRERWPSVLRVDDDSHLTTFYMAYTENYGRPSYIVLKKSTDARFEGSPRTKLVREEECCNNQNPALFQDPRTKSFYLYWFRQCAMKINPCEGHKNWEIWVKEASSVEGLADPNIRPKQLMERPWTIAAPQVMYHRGKYYLAVETRRKRPVAPGDGETWYTWVYSSSDPQGPFTLLPGNPLLGDGSGCFFQYIFDGTLHAYYCKQTPPVIDGPDQGLTWTIDHRTSDPGAGGALVPKEDGENWPGFSSDVREQLVPSVLNRDGSEDVVLQVEMTDEPYQIFESSFSGEDYVVEVNGRQVGGGAWGLGVRVSDSSLYSVSVSNGVDAGSKLSLNRWDDNEATFGLDASIGEVEVGEWVRLTAKVHSSEIEVDVNGQKKLETKDDKAIASGRVALYGERGTTAQFSNVFVRKYAAMEPTVSISPAH